MAKKMYTVQEKDTLTKIANNNGVKVDDLVKWNNIENKDLIYVGQVLFLEDPAGENKVADNALKITAFGLKTNKDNELFVTWTLTTNNIKEYKVIWKINNKENIDVVSRTETVPYSNHGGTRYSTYSVDKNEVNSVWVTVEAYSTTEEVDGKTTEKWPMKDATSSKYSFRYTPSKPPVPSVTLEEKKLKASLTNVGDLNATHIIFEIIRDDSEPAFDNSKEIAIVTGAVSYTKEIVQGSKYKVRCCSYNNGLTSDWSNYSENVNSAPKTPVINSVQVYEKAKNTIAISWTPANSAEKYIIEYVQKNEKEFGDALNHFEAINSPKTSVEVEIKESEAKDGEITKLITNIESGKEYYIRMAATNKDSKPPYNFSNIEEFIIGTTPDIPSTWSSTTTAVVGEPLNLGWIQNSKDNSRMKNSKLVLYIDGVLFTPTEGLTEESYIITEEAFEDDIISVPEFKDDETARLCYIKTDYFNEGSKIEWKVATAGVNTDDYGKYSILRTVNIYSKPILSIGCTKENGDVLDYYDNISYKLESLPFNIVLQSGNLVNQKVIGYTINIIANSSYKTINELGNDQMVVSGSSVYSKYFDTNEETFIATLSASDLDIKDGINYEIVGTATMDSGLTATASTSIQVMWSFDASYIPDAEVTINKEDFSAYIRPYANGTGDVLLSVYRREYDGSFTPIITDILDGENTYVVDPHPSLDYARYRIVAKSKTNGKVTYSDLSSIYIGEKSIIIQWDEKWQNFHASSNGETLVDRPWSGSMLRLPYNIDISDSFDPDVSLVEYIGRKRPVSYYGTQIRESSSWSTEIPKTDTETLFAIRRLAVWMGNAYVREPSGTGYWAHVNVSYSKSYSNLIIPVSFEITRVEGGM